MSCESSVRLPRRGEDGGGLGDGGVRKGNVRKLGVTAIVGRCERQRQKEERRRED